jgi:hypothetical protein
MFDIEQTVINPLGKIPVRVTSRPVAGGSSTYGGGQLLNSPGAVLAITEKLLPEVFL